MGIPWYGYVFLLIAGGFFLAQSDIGKSLVGLVLDRGKNKEQDEALRRKIQATLPSAPLTQKQQRGLALTGVLTYARMEDILSLVPTDDVRLHEYPQGLEIQWGVTDRSSAVQTVQTLLTLTKSQSLDAQWQQDDKDVRALKKKLVKELKVDASTVDAVKSTYAWDVMRAAAVAKWSFWCGYIDADTLWGLLDEAEAVAAEHGEGWTEYIISFLAGRTLHGFEFYDLAYESMHVLHRGEKLKPDRREYDVDAFSKVTFPGASS